MSNTQERTNPQTIWTNITKVSLKPANEFLKTRNQKHNLDEEELTILSKEQKSISNKIISLKHPNHNALNIKILCQKEIKS